MMWFFPFFLMRIKQIGQQATLWLLLLGTVFVSIIPVMNFEEGIDDTVRIALINEDSGVFSKSFIDSIQEIEMLELTFPESFDAAMKSLARGKVEGVVVIHQVFSEHLSELEFSDMFSVYVSPSTSIGKLLAEIFSEKVIEIWAQEVVIDDYVQFRIENNLQIIDSLKSNLREEMETASRSSELLLTQYNFLGEGIQYFSKPEVVTKEDIVTQSMLWFCALVGFFIILSSRWVIDQRRSAIGERIASLGISPLVVSIASGMAVVFYCVFASSLSLFLSTFYVSLEFTLYLKYFIFSLLYFVSMVGVSVMISAILQTSIDLMIIAPMLTMINSVLGGMFVELPSWAIFLQKISYLLPGRMLNHALTENAWLVLSLGSVCYFSVGILVSSVITGKGCQS